MASIEIRFAVSLKRWDLVQHPFSPDGPIFSRWLPNGQEDAISLKLHEQDALLSLWFQRYGEAEGSFIKFSRDKHEVDPELMTRQAALDAGPLRGRVRLDGLERTTLEAVSEDRLGSPEYESLGRRVIKKILEPEVGRFLAILRRNFGQYWLTEWEEWDSRERSLGQHCHLLNMKWSADGGESWSDFIPNERTSPTLVLNGSMHGEIRELTQADWNGLESVWQSGYQPSFGAEVLVRAHEHVDQGNLRFALIEAVTALEIAIEEFAERKLEQTDELSSAVNQFHQSLSLQAQLTVVAGSAALVPPEDLQAANKAVDLRNAVVHEGAAVRDDDRKLIKTLLRTTAKLLHGPTFRFPSDYVGRALRSPESWAGVPEPELDLEAIGLEAQD